MATPLSNWIDNSIQGVLIIYPQSLNKSNVANVISSTCKHVTIISDSKYSDLDYVNKLLHSPGIVLFDDTKMFSIICPALLPPFRAKVIILTTWGDTLRQLNTVIEKFPHLYLLDLDIIHNQTPIKWSTVRVPLSPRQVYYYNLARQQEVKAHPSNRIIPYNTTRMLTLYAYPDNFMLSTLTGNQSCQHNDKNFIPLFDTSEVVSEVSFRPLLEKNGPKLLSVLDGVVSNWPKKQIIVTRFGNNYGVELIRDMLHLLTELKQNPYESNEIFSLSCTDSYDEMIEILTQFNNTEAAVLVTNVVPIVPLSNVSTIHVADSYSFLTLQGIINKLGQSELSVYSHVAQHPNSISADEALHLNLEGYIKEADRIYDELRAQANKISFHPSCGLTVL